jgi:hypothetical protein
MDDATFAVVPIRYDGMDAERHQIELSSLGESLQGMARVLAVTGHFVLTQEYVKQYQAHDVKVLVGEPKANCFTIQAVLEFAKQQQVFSGTAGVALGSILTWLFARSANRRDEMKAIKDSLDKAIETLAGNNQETVQRMLSTMERMADALRPAVREAVKPIGRTCTHMTVDGSIVVDQAAADAIRSESADEVTAEKTWRVRITELDVESSTAKVRLDGDAQQERRIKAIITDPSARVLANAYAQALLSQAEIDVRGKATLRDGEIAQLYISNTV